MLGNRKRRKYAFGNNGFRRQLCRLFRRELRSLSFLKHFLMTQQRSEWKFLCSDGQIEMIRSRLSAILAHDPHAEPDGSYTVHSLYFDDYWNSCAAGNESGNGLRCKYRIRCYGNSSGGLHFERKEKCYGYGSKLSCAISPEEYRNLIAGNYSEVFWNTEEILLKKFCTLSMMRFFTPKVIVDYKRTAFVEPAANIRITLDQEICAAPECSEFLNGSYFNIPILGKNQNILEVKFDEILPSWLKRMIESLRLQQTTFSKYYLGRKKLENLL